MKRILICGAGGFIGTHLTKRLKKEGYWIRGVDIKKPEYSKTMADEFLLIDLRKRKNCQKALTVANDLMKFINLPLTVVAQDI